MMRRLLWMTAASRRRRRKSSNRGGVVLVVRGDRRRIGLGPQQHRDETTGERVVRRGGGGGACSWHGVRSRGHPGWQEISAVAELWTAGAKSTRNPDHRSAAGDDRREAAGMMVMEMRSWNDSASLYRCTTQLTRTQRAV